jgi:hypothetical protein
MVNVGLKLEIPNNVSYWQEQISKADKRYQNFHLDGDKVECEYRGEKSNEQYTGNDKYNILYSSTETIKPSLYGQTPKVQATKRFSDVNNPKVTLAATMLEVVTQYLMEEVEFDDIMENVVEDYVLAGLGCAWVRYEATIEDVPAQEGAPATQRVSYEGAALDYVHWKDFRTGPARTWQTVPWVARRVYFGKEDATKRFGAEKANKMSFSHNKPESDDSLGEEAAMLGQQAIIWEIWNKVDKKVYWYSADSPEMLDEKEDPLKLKHFFPCPRPLRAVKSNSKFVPKSFYSQYKAQAEELNRLTQRIRYLTEALKVRGVYDGSQKNLETLLNGPGNKMVSVDNWAMFAQAGGLNGSVQWLPIKDVANTLNELYKQREIVKAEIYEITGFSDIVRGVSKASETLGAQQIKADWAGGRLRSMQREVQRFCRDIIRIMSEIAFEQFSDQTLMMYSGFALTMEGKQEQQQQQMQAQQAGLAIPNAQTPDEAMFGQVAAMLRDERQRCAMIGIETDSTILADEAKEREDRMAFLSAIGAYLQQAAPMVMQYPDMRGLLGSIMMFTVNTFTSARPIEIAFEEFTKTLENAPPPKPEDDGKAAAEQAKVQAAQMQTQAKQQLESLASQERIQMAQIQAASAEKIATLKIQVEQEKLALERDTKSRELAIREREVAVKERQLEMEGEIEAERLALEAAEGAREDERLELDATTAVAEQLAPTGPEIA